MQTHSTSQVLDYLCQVAGLLGDAHASLAASSLALVEVDHLLGADGLASGQAGTAALAVL